MKTTFNNPENGSGDVRYLLTGARITDEKAEYLRNIVCKEMFIEKGYGLADAIYEITENAETAEEAIVDVHYYDSYRQQIMNLMKPREDKSPGAILARMLMK